MRKASIIVCAGFFIFIPMTAVLGVCPQRLGPHNENFVGCPDLFKSQWTTMYWWQNEVEGKTYGRGKCGSGLQCWPAFEQPYIQAAGSDATYNYRYYVHKVKEQTVFYPEFEEPGCGVYNTIIFEFPDLAGPGKCYKEVGTCLGQETGLLTLRPVALQVCSSRVRALVVQHSRVDATNTSKRNVPVAALHTNHRL